MTDLNWFFVSIPNPLLDCRTFSKDFILSSCCHLTLSFICPKIIKERSFFYKKKKFHILQLFLTKEHFHLFLSFFETNKKKGICSGDESHVNILRFAQHTEYYIGLIMVLV